jgi:Putative auto-transporter adhesin, head GIN domain
MRSAIFSTVLMMLSFSFSSCLFLGPSVKGDGNVKEEIRKVEDFHGVRVTSGMNVHLVQGDQIQVLVVADKNLHKVIETRVEDGILEVRAHANIWRAKEKKVIITSPDIREITGTAGSNIYTDNQLKAGQMRIKGSAGSNLHINVDGQNIETSASSGSNIYLEGTAGEIIIRVSSGANIKAGDIKSGKGDVKASSGGNVWITVEKELIADASSGGNIFYYGTPDSISTSSSSGGNIIKK